jgi:hypothetical protein
MSRIRSFDLLPARWRLRDRGVVGALHGSRRGARQRDPMLAGESRVAGAARVGRDAAEFPCDYGGCSTLQFAASRFAPHQCDPSVRGRLHGAADRLDHRPFAQAGRGHPANLLGAHRATGRRRHPQTRGPLSGRTKCERSWRRAVGRSWKGQWWCWLMLASKPLI